VTFDIGNPDHRTPTVAFIDASLTGLAICVATPTTVLQLVELGSKPAKGLRGRFDRYRGLVRQVQQVLRPYGTRLDVIGIEGYAFASKTSGTTLGEFGGVLRLELLHFGPVLEVAPTTLKLFGAGKGNAKKLEMVSAVTKRYGREFDTDNKADAFAGAQLMLCAIGAVEPATDAQRKACETVQSLRAREAA
jgi:Holliday junction resolvasome RuvABC endonuclease subunit